MIYYRTVSRGIGPAKFSTHGPESEGENVQAGRIRKWEEGGSHTHTSGSENELTEENRCKVQQQQQQLL